MVVVATKHEIAERQCHHLRATTLTQVVFFIDPNVDSPQVGWTILIPVAHLQPDR